MKQVLFLLFLILGANIAAAQSQSRITVDVNKSGDAIWTIEKFIPLTKSDLNEWENAVKMGQNMSRYRNISEYEAIIKAFQNYTMNFSNRSMEIEPYNITYDTRKTLSDGLGIIRYTFVWKNFSYNDSKNIFIGDAFPGGLLLLSPENQLIIKIPAGYEVTNVTPVFDKRNGNLLIWDGTVYSNFSNGEPFIELTPLNVTNVTAAGNEQESYVEEWPIKEIVIILLSIMALVAFVRLWKKRRLGNASTTDMVTQVPKEMLHEISEIPGAWTKIVKSIQNEYGDQSVEELEKAAREQRLKNIGIDSSIPLSELTKEDLEDEEMIKQFLLRSGGQAYQSDIVEHSGLSKSKISMVLSKMKDEGIIIKIRKGKENLIRLVPEINEK
jgi:DNA-binding transcriptional ArsR family regulator